MPQNSSEGFRPQFSKTDLSNNRDLHNWFLHFFPLWKHRDGWKMKDEEGGSPCCSIVGPWSSHVFVIMLFSAVEVVHYPFSLKCLRRRLWMRATRGPYLECVHTWLECSILIFTTPTAEPYVLQSFAQSFLALWYTRGCILWCNKQSIECRPLT